MNRGGSTLNVALGTQHPAPLKVSTELTGLYTGLYSAELDFGGSTLEASGLVLLQ